MTDTTPPWFATLEKRIKEIGTSPPSAPRHERLDRLLAELTDVAAELRRDLAGLQVANARLRLDGTVMQAALCTAADYINARQCEAVTPAGEAVLANIRQAIDRAEGNL